MAHEFYPALTFPRGRSSSLKAPVPMGDLPSLSREIPAKLKLNADALCPRTSARTLPTPTVAERDRRGADLPPDRGGIQTVIHLPERESPLGGSNAPPSAANLKKRITKMQANTLIHIAPLPDSPTLSEPSVWKDGKRHPLPGEFIFRPELDGLVSEQNGCPIVGVGDQFSEICLVTDATDDVRQAWEAALAPGV
jgi:hypothetical protein